MEYEIYICGVWGNEDDGYTVNNVLPTGKFITAGASKAVLSKKLGLDDPRKIDIDMTNENVVYVDYDGKPCYELRLVQ